MLGYLRLVERLASDDRFAGGWNFGPHAASEVPVGTAAGHLVAMWGDGARWTADAGPPPHEAACLRLDCAKARSELGWRPQLDLAQGLRLTSTGTRRCAGAAICAHSRSIRSSALADIQLA